MGAAGIYSQATGGAGYIRLQRQEERQVAKDSWLVKNSNQDICAPIWERRKGEKQNSPFTSQLDAHKKKMHESKKDHESRDFIHSFIQ